MATPAESRREKRLARFKPNQLADMTQRQSPRAAQLWANRWNWTYSEASNPVNRKRHKSGMKNA